MIDLEYELRFALESKTLRVHSIEDITEDESVFKKSYNTTKTVFQFVNKVEFPMKVPLLKPLIDLKEIEHELVYCEVAVGQAIYASEEYALNFPPPIDYDTFLTTTSNVSGNGMVFDGDNELVQEVNENVQRGKSQDLQSLSIENAYYVIREQSKIRPLYRVRFEYDHSLESSDDKLCESCYTDLSVCFCYAEKAQLCAKCDSVLHYNELTRRHQRHYFNEENTKFMHCAMHSQIVDFWCMECEVPVCTHCRIKGNHSMLSEHSLISYKEAWTMNQGMLNSDKSIEHSVKEMTQSIEEYQNSYEEFVIRVKELKGIIREEYCNTINKIDHLQSKNYKTVFRKYLEKLADLERLKKMQSFRPNNFLSFFKAMKEQRNEVHLDLTPIEVEPIKVTGGFRVNAKGISKREGLRPKRMSSDFYFESVE